MINNRENLEHQNNNSNVPTSRVRKLRHFIAASVLAIASYYGYEMYKEGNDEPKIKNIPMVPYEGKHLTKVRIDVADWQNYAREITKILSAGESEQVRKLYSDFFLELMAHESSYDAQNKSKTGAAGLTQITDITFVDFLQDHRKNKYISRILKIRDTNPDLIKKLPNPLFQAIMNLRKNPSDEEVGRLVGILEFFSKRSIHIEWAKIDPHTSILLGAIIYDIKYDEWQEAPENIERVFDRVVARTQGTKYSLPDNYKYGPNLKGIIYALYNYNGDKTELEDVPTVSARDAYVSYVMNSYKNNSSAQFLPKNKK